MNDGQNRGVAIGLLSFAAGAMDAIAFLALGEVFTSAMSGNTILLGLALAQGRFVAALHSLAAFVGYVLGVAGAALPLRTLPQGIERTLTVEALLLAAFAGVWIVGGGPSGPSQIYALIVLSAIAMGLQGAIGRVLRIAGIPTIVITSTLTAIVGAFTESVLKREGWKRSAPTRQQLASFAAYLASAIIVGFGVSRWLALMPFLPLAAVLVVLLALRLRLLRL